MSHFLLLKLSGRHYIISHVCKNRTSVKLVQILNATAEEKSGNCKGRRRQQSPERTHLRATFSKASQSSRAAVSNQRRAGGKGRYLANEQDDSLKGRESCCSRRLMSNYWLLLCTQLGLPPGRGGRLPSQPYQQALWGSSTPRAAPKVWK